MTQDQEFLIEILRVFAWPTAAVVCFIIVMVCLPFVKNQLFSALTQSLNHASTVAGKINSSLEQMKAEADRIEQRLQTFQNNVRQFSSTFDYAAGNLEEVLAARNEDGQGSTTDPMENAEAVPLINQATRDLDSDSNFKNEFVRNRQLAERSAQPDYGAIMAAWQALSTRGAEIARRLGGFPKQSAFNSTIADFLLEKGNLTEVENSVLKAMFSARKSMSRIKSRPGFEGFGETGVAFIALCRTLSDRLNTK